MPQFVQGTYSPLLYKNALCEKNKNKKASI
jgi:hypothetical protein